MNTRVLAGAGALLIGAWIAGRAFRAARYTLRDKVVLISGGSRGLGLVLARHICEQHGKVVLIARDREELARAKADLAVRGGKVLTIECDLLDRAQIHAAVRTAIDRLGKIDILINNAGIIEVGPLNHMNREDFDRAMQLHFWAPYELVSQVVPEMRLWGRTHCKHFVHWRQDRSAAFGAVRRQQVCVDRFLRCDSSGAGAR